MYIIIYQIRMDVTTKKEKNFFSTTIDVFSTISNIDFLTIIVFSFVYLIVFDTTLTGSVGFFGN